MEGHGEKEVESERERKHPVPQFTSLTRCNDRADRAEAGSQELSLSWEAGSQLLEPSPPASRGCTMSAGQSQKSEMFILLILLLSEYLNQIRKNSFCCSKARIRIKSSQDQAVEYSSTKFIKLKPKDLSLLPNLKQLDCLR